MHRWTLRSLQKGSSCWAMDLTRSRIEVAMRVGEPLQVQVDLHLRIGDVEGEEDWVQGEEPGLWVLLSEVKNPGGCSGEIGRRGVLWLQVGGE